MYKLWSTIAVMGLIDGLAGWAKSYGKSFPIPGRSLLCYLLFPALWHETEMAEAPLCKCNEPAIQLTVKKDSPNKGRQFWRVKKKSEQRRLHDHSFDGSWSRTTYSVKHKGASTLRGILLHSKRRLLLVLLRLLLQVRAATPVQKQRPVTTIHTKSFRKRK